MLGDTIGQSQVTQYRHTFEPGQPVTVTLVVTSSDADLYIWRPGSMAVPDYIANRPGTATEQLVFTAVEGEYLIEVQGYFSSQYGLDITMGTVGSNLIRQNSPSQPIQRPTMVMSKPLPWHPLVATRPGGASPTEQPKHYGYLPLILRSN